MSRKYHIAIVASAEMTVNSFLKNHITEFNKSYDVSVIVNTKSMEILSLENVEVLPVPIKRSINPLHDLYCLSVLIKIFFSKRFDMVFSVTPKAGMLTMLAGYFARTRIRLHMFTGQTWATKKGPARYFLKHADLLIASCATNILVDSMSQQKYLINEGVITEDTSVVLANGSICGVDIQRFRPDIEGRKKTRKEIGIAEEDILLLFIGRLKKDKGILDLAYAFEKVISDIPNIRLLIIGPDEEMLTPVIRDICKSSIDNIHFMGYTTMPEKYMASSDIFCLPSYREGFGSVIIEAASSGIPAIASRIYGITDAVDDGHTGILHSPGNTGEICMAIRALINDVNKRKVMGEAARKRAHKLFDSDIVTVAMQEYCNKLLVKT